MRHVPTLRSGRVAAVAATCPFATAPAANAAAPGVAGAGFTVSDAMRKPVAAGGTVPHGCSVEY
jgi:hypothetical protein